MSKTEKIFSATVGGKALLALCRMTSTNKTRQTLACIHAEVAEDGIVSLIATDGYRLAVYTLAGKADKALAGEEALYSAAEVKSLIKASSRICVTVSANGFKFTTVKPCYEIPRASIEEAYPAWRNLAQVKPAPEAAHIVQMASQFGAEAYKAAQDCGMPAVLQRSAGSAGAIVLQSRDGDGNELLQIIMPQCNQDVVAPAACGADWAATEADSMRDEIEQLHAFHASDIEREARAQAEIIDKGNIIDRLSARVAELEAQLAKNDQARTAPEAPEDASDLQRFALANALGYRRTTACEWVSGDTRPHAAALKAAGMRWSSKKSAWYRRLEDAETATIAA